MLLNILQYTRQPRMKIYSALNVNSVKAEKSGPSQTPPPPPLGTHFPLLSPKQPLPQHTEHVLNHCGPWFHILLEVIRASASAQLKPSKFLADFRSSQKMSTKSLLHNLIYDKGGISILWEAMDYSINGIGTNGWPSGRE